MSIRNGNWTIWNNTYNLKSIDKLGLYNALMQDCGIVTNETIETFEAVAVNTEEAGYMGVQKKAAAQSCMAPADSIYMIYVNCH